MILAQQSKSSALPVSVADIKRHLNIDYARDDDYLTLLIQAADEFVERETDRAFVSQVWKLTLSGFPTSKIYLPKPPVVSVSSIKYYDGDNVQQTYSSDNYYVISADDAVGFVEVVEAFPATYWRPDAVEVTWTAGASTPNLYIQLLKLLVGAWYANREGEVVGQVPASLRLGVDRLTNLLRHGRYV